MDRRLIDVFPRDQHRFASWFNVLNEAYVKARYSEHFEITQEALVWLIDQTERLQAIVQALCQERIDALEAKLR